MSIPPWDWEARGFDPDADLTIDILSALLKESPEAAVYARWPWLSNAIIRQFVEAMKTATGDDRRLLIERFQHAIRASWSDKYEPKYYRRPTRLPWWRRWFKKDKGENNEE